MLILQQKTFIAVNVPSASNHFETDQSASAVHQSIKNLDQDRNTLDNLFAEMVVNIPQEGLSRLSYNLHPQKILAQADLENAEMKDNAPTNTEIQVQTTVSNKCLE